MLLIKKICDKLNKPVFEVMDYPETELEYQALFFSIDENKDKPILTPVKLTLAQTKDKIRGVFK